MKTGTKRPLIAVVEDDPDFRSMLCRWLKPRYRTTEFDSAEALLESGGECADARLIVTDVMMPGLSGFRLCRLLSAHPLYHHVPVIFLTGVRGARGFLRGLESGGSAYMNKPVERMDFLDQVEKLLDRDSL